jgi:autotransporter-associated beta strand protein
MKASPYHKRFNIKPLKTFCSGAQCALLLLGAGAILTQQAAAQDAGLVGQWPFNEGTGTNAFDATTNANPGVLLGNDHPLPLWTNGVSSTALCFDGAWNEVQVPSAPVLTPSASLTVAAWIQVAPNVTGTTIAKWNTAANTGSYLLTVSNGAPGFQVSINGTAVAAQSSLTLPDTLWHHLAGTYDGTAVRVFLDGVEQTNVAASGTVDAVSAPLRIGLLPGRLDDARLYEVALTADQLLALVNADTDGDGFTDQWEANHGYDPNNASSNPKTPPAGAVLTWDASGAVGGPWDGNGIWNTTSSNWLYNGYVIPWSNGRVAAFGVSPIGNNVITLASTIAPAGLWFNPGTGSYTIAGSGAISLSGAVTATASNNAAISAVMVGSGSLVKAGNGRLSLSGANNYTGGTTVNAGTLQYPFSSRPGWNHGGVNQLAIGTVTVAAGATLELNDTDNILENVLFTGGTTITGAGTINKTGAGQIEFWNPGTPSHIGSFTGQINVLAGTLGNNNSDWGSGAGRMNLNLAPGTFFDMRSGDVKVDQLSGGGRVTNSWTGGAGTLSVGNNNGSATFSGVIQDGSSVRSFVKNGTGTQILSGANTYTGRTTISNGTLMVNGSLAAASWVTNTANGTLAGTGTVGGPLWVFGTVDPGANAVGTLNTGPVYLYGGCTINCKIASAEETNTAGRDFVNVNGTLYLDWLTNGVVTVKLISMLNSNTPGEVPNFDPASNYCWTVAAATSASISGNYDALNRLQLDTSGFSNAFGGTFSLSPNLAPHSLEIRYAGTAGTLPEVTLASPADGACTNEAGTMLLSANVNLNGHSLYGLMFYMNNSPMVDVYSPPFTGSLSGLGAGTYTVYALLVYDWSADNPMGFQLSSQTNTFYVLGPLALTSTGTGTDGNFQLTFSGPTGQPYRVLGTDDLTKPLDQWMELDRGNIPDTSATFTDTNTAAHSQQFYRVVSP